MGQQVAEQVAPAQTDVVRLRAAADRIAQLHEDLSAEQERRDGLIVALRDSGLTWPAIAKASRLSQARCVAIAAIGSMT